MYRAFWLDSKKQRWVELRRSGPAPQMHMAFVLENGEFFGFTDEQIAEIRALPRLPYEIGDYPRWFVDALMGRWIKVNVDEMFVSFTTTDRFGRQHIEAMQDFLLGTKLSKHAVFIAGEPSGRMIARILDTPAFLTMRQPGEVRRAAAMFRAVTALTRAGHHDLAGQLDAIEKAR